jgi:hypothetical protein
MLAACRERAGAFVDQQIIRVKDRGVLTRSHDLWKHWRRPNRPPKVAEETLPSTWALPSFAKDERPDHPTPKPLDAFGIPMRQHVARGGLCHQPFSGSGSQIVKGVANGRRDGGVEAVDVDRDVASAAGGNAVQTRRPPAFRIWRTDRMSDPIARAASWPSFGAELTVRMPNRDRPVTRSSPPRAVAGCRGRTRTAQRPRGRRGAANAPPPRR